MPLENKCQIIVNSGYCNIIMEMKNDSSFCWFYSESTKHCSITLLQYRHPLHPSQNKDWNSHWLSRTGQV